MKVADGDDKRVPQRLRRGAGGELPVQLARHEPSRSHNEASSHLVPVAQMRSVTLSPFRPARNGGFILAAWRHTTDIPNQSPSGALSARRPTMSYPNTTPPRQVPDTDPFFE